MLLLTLLFFSGCQGVTLSDEMDLLQAPMLNLEQKAVYQALEATLDTSEIVYQYPHEGDYRTPFAFFDLDGDGLDEAIVFYSEKEDSNTVYAKVLQQNEKGEWHSFRDLAGHGNRIGFLDFMPMISQDHFCIVIGWEDTENPRNNHLGVYSIHDETKEGNLQEQDILESYENYSVYDFDGDGLMELLIARKNREGRYQVVLIKSVLGTLKQVDQVLLNPDTFSILQMLPGNLWGSRKGVYIDQRIMEPATSSGFWATEVIEVRSGQLKVVVGYGGGEKSQALDNYNSTFRPEYALSADLWGNGTVCVPQIDTLPGLADSDSNRSVKLTEYHKLAPEGFESLYNTIVNAENGYLILLPDRWLGNIIVEQKPELREWRIYKLTHEVHPETGESTSEKSSELFRVRVHQQGDPQDPSAEADIVLATKGTFTYYGYVPEIPGEELALTGEEAKQMFALVEG